MNFSVCIEMIFNELPFYERFAAVKNAGINAAEIWGWAHRDLSELKRAISLSGVSLSSMCVDSKDEDVSKRYKNNPIVSNGSEGIFCEIVHHSVEAAKQLGVKNLIVTTGQESEDLSREKQQENIISALLAAAPIFETNGLTAVIEPLNTLIDHKGYYLSTSKQAADIINEVSSKNVKMLFDVYHQQITEGNVINNIKKYIDIIGHFHIADNPGRNEPGTGELNYSSIFRAISKTKYSGYIGLEFSPKADDTQVLLELQKL
ncbi:MAG TPA: TIM barrel protein [Oscillospiraceae bacterium]|nr:TIM barrel protein [Oscillospiraceae bacterium]